MEEDQLNWALGMDTESFINCSLNQLDSNLGLGMVNQGIPDRLIKELDSNLDLSMVNQGSVNIFHQDMVAILTYLIKNIGQYKDQLDRYQCQEIVIFTAADHSLHQLDYNLGLGMAMSMIMVNCKNLSHPLNYFDHMQAWQIRCPNQLDCNQ